MTQSLRSLPTDRWIRVHAVLTDPVDTDMSRGVDFPEASPRSAALAINDAIARGDDKFLPDAMSGSRRP